MTTKTSKPPKSPNRTRDARATRAALVTSATRLMHVNGYNATSLDDVLRDSGVGKGNFYYHFRSKEDLGYAILDQLIAGFLQRTLEPCFSDPTERPLAQIRCFLDRVLDIQRQRNCVGGCPMGNLASELSDVHEGFRTRLASVFSAWRERLSVALADAKDRGEVSQTCTPATVAHFLVASLEGSILLARVAKDIGVMEQCMAELKRYLSIYEVPA
jgi:TetR/AcrR family transcriptional repressor of nem operon